MSSSCSPRDKKMLDVLVIGGGNAALCAAITARRAGATVKLIEASPKDVRGGNSRHTRNIRYIHPSKNSFLTGPYEEEECYKDLLGVTKGNTIESMARLVIRGSNNVGDWMMEQGVHFQPAMRGTLHLSRTNGFFLGGGKALINAYYATAEKLGVEIAYETEAVDLCIEDDTFKWALVHHNGEEERIEAKAVVLASGGYQANIEWLKRSWGPQAANFLIRGTPYDRGQMLKVMMEHGAKTLGDPTQGHCVAIDGRAPKFDGGICTRLDCVPFGIAVNKNCQRFYDEGEEIWPKRYAIWGRLVAEQPDQVAYIIIDSKSINLFMPSVFPPIEAKTIAEMAAKMELDPEALEKTVAEFNAHTVPGGNFNSGDKDGIAGPGTQEEQLGSSHRHPALLRLLPAPGHHLLVLEPCHQREGTGSQGKRHALQQHLCSRRNHLRQRARAGIHGRFWHDHRNRFWPHCR